MVEIDYFVLSWLVLFSCLIKIQCKENETKATRIKCEKRIYHDCNYPMQFTEEELENVRIFLNYSFTQLADIKPDKPLCKRIHVRQDWKCLTKDQKKRTINVWKQLYENGVVQKLADLHYRYWPAWHKTVEFGPSHRWFLNQFEKAMRYIDPSLTLPYWESSLYGTQPERSSIWQTLGRNGSYSNGYCVEDGIYKNLKLEACVKRHWSPRGTIYPWYTPELVTKIIHSDSYDDFTNQMFAIHFQPHLSIGGYEGQMSIPNAPYDLLFYVYHNSYDMIKMKYHFSRREFLTPLHYSYGNFLFEPINGNVIRGKVGDMLTGIPNTSMKETFWIGFGDYCYIPDQLIRPINNIIKGKTDPIPTALKRLPKLIVKKYFPGLLNPNSSSLLHMFEEVGDCNQECRPIPKPTFMTETEAGRRQIKGYASDNGLDESSVLHSVEQMAHKLWKDLKKYNYCSPYVTSYN